MRATGFVSTCEKLLILEYLFLVNCCHTHLSIYVNYKQYNH